MAHERLIHGRSLAKKATVYQGISHLNLACGYVSGNGVNAVTCAIAPEIIFLCCLPVIRGIAR